MQEFQKEQEALKQISEANKRMERSKLEREKNAKMLDEELDKVPTKQPKKNPRKIPGTVELTLQSRSRVHSSRL